MDGTLEILDIKERKVGEVKPPSFPTPPPASSGGFPAPKKRVSAFKKQRQQQADPSSSSASSSAQATPSTPSPSIKFTSGAKPQIDEDPIKSEKKRIDEENNKLLSSMSPEEIAEAQRELFNGLDPRLIQMLLRRANVEDGSNNNDPKVWDIPEKPVEKPTTEEPTEKPTTKSSEKKADDSGPTISYKKPPSIKTTTSKSAYVEDEQEESDQPKKPKKSVTFNEDLAPEHPPRGSFPIRSKQPPTPYPQKTSFSEEDLATPTSPTAGSSSEPQTPVTPSTCNDPSHNHSADSEEDLKGVHFPTAPPPPELDPSDPNFLSTLHEKFFPSLPADPSKLAWMAPIPTEDSPADKESPYYPGQSSLPVSALRFDFKGRLIPPRLSRQIPVSKGLHHHGEAPEAAGYTIPELARLARSSVNSQRCIAFRTLGRMLYRLGKGEWGTGAGGRDGDEDDLAFGLWRCFQEGRVLESIGEAAAVEEGVGSVSVRAYAIEAMWLFEKGGWKEKWRGL
ncbi:RPAP1-like protein [Sordaria brevicollis]|uniref:RPAP1-like protein n=1 Tax=Sordaria brevicollis TaxID=83679 RepID=A0AAE0NVT0_SORBR|nr:RPAP1-like protein [Sordaria brevicollis]